jgi:YidC/Oxa1 family membrane protein insertase
MERNAIIATVLVILILMGYQWYLSRFEAPQQEPAKSPASASPSPPRTAEAPRPAPQAAPQPPPRPKGFTPTAALSPPPREVVVETPLLRVVLSTAGARVTSWQLKRYRAGDGAPVELVAARDQAPGPLGAWADPEQARAIFLADRDRLEIGSQAEEGTVTFSHIAASGVELKKRLTFRRDGYQAEVELTVRNVADAEATVQPRLVWGPGLIHSPDKKASTLQPPTLWLDGKRVQEDLTKIGGEKVAGGNVAWAALQDTYFAAALVPKAKLGAFVMKAAGDQPLIGLLGERQVLPPGGQTATSLWVFAGPKDLDVLRAAGHELDQLVDLGWFDFLARPALWLLKLLYGYTGNYGLAIILVTVMQKVAFHPLTLKSLRSMQAMQAIQPKLQAIQERFKNNPQKKQEEMMALYKKHGVNPMGGCLPMVVQIPIFIALYNALSSSVEMWQAPFLWIRDLTQPDALFTVRVWGGYNFSANILALLMGASQWVQTKMSPPAGDPRQAQLMLWMMPILFTFMFWGFPSGLVLYWLVNNVLQIGQQWLILAKPPRPAAAEGQAA